MKEYLLFDLDGTLTDPKVGITTCVQYALHSFGIEEPDLDKLEPFIGPPLKDSFQEFYHMSEEQASLAVEKYRERFRDIGIFENKVYAGIPALLRNLKEKGMHLAVASSKPTVFVERILEHFHIDKFFEVVVGSELDGSRQNKDEVVEEALRRLFGEKPIERDKVYMIGDRKYDAEGARAHHIESVGVTYGYGSMEELRAAHADYIVRSVEELERFLLRGAGEQQDGQKKRFTPWYILYSFLLFMIVRNLVAVMGQAAVQSAGLDITGNIGTVIGAIGFIGAGIAIFSKAKAVLVRTQDDMYLLHLKGEQPSSYVFLGMATVGAVLGFNLLFDLTGLISKSATYQAVAADQFAASIPVLLICNGLIAPVAEELLFRGIIFGYARHFLDLKLAIVLSAALFGFYHGNMVQGIYGLLMGCLMAYGYEYFGSFAVPVVIHIVSNVLGILLSFTPIALTGFVSWPVCAVFLALMAAGLIGLNKQKKLF